MSKPEKFCILVLDDDICLTTTLAKALRTGLSSAEVIIARSVAEAQLLVSEYKIHFFILDVDLPDGNGIDFLCDIRTCNAEARVVMMGTQPDSEQQTRARELGVLLFQKKPVDTKEIIKLARGYYESMGHATVLQYADGQFAVSLTCLSALDIIQLKCLSNATLVLQVASPSGIGRIYFEEGQIVHAETLDIRGEDAFEQILRWKGGRIKEMPVLIKPTRTITTGWQGLLLNLAQRIDETTPNAMVH